MKHTLPAIIFEIASVQLRDQFGNLVMCTGCNGTFWHVTLRPGQPEQILCANEDCGRQVTQ